jgi:septum formation protein
VDTASGAVFDCAVESRVSMREASDEALRDYVATGEPLDKAGAYAIQGEGAWLVTGFEGSRTNIIGLPLEETLSLLSQAGFPVPNSTA